MYATYNITDNRIKFYPENAPRLTPEQDKKRRELKFQWWPGRKCFTAIWSPYAEDWVKQFCEIDQDNSPDDIEARVSRYTKYADGAEAEAADAAERAITANTERRARLASNSALKQAERAEYWTNRIAGAIAHAQRHDSPRTCLNRIKGIEKDLRKFQKDMKFNDKMITLWKLPNLTREQALNIAGYDHITVYFTKDKYPKSTYEGASSIWGGLDGEIITVEQAISLAIPAHEKSLTYYARWVVHLTMRLQYEQEYYKALGGTL